jgi:branched-chain amino acid transport system substrate-binding protein
MKVWKISAILACLAFWSIPASAAEKELKIGVLEDMSGNFAAPTGPGSVVAAKLAAEDVGGSVNGQKIVILSASHQNKADVGGSIARQWFDQNGVSAITGLGNSAVALAVSSVARQMNKVELVSGSATNALTGKACSPNTVQWTFDNYSLSHAIVPYAIKHGGTSWFFITVDFAFGHDLQKNTEDAVRENGGTVIGAVAHPLGTQDFSSYVLQAQGSKAKVIALANGGQDTDNGIKAIKEFHLDKQGQSIVALSPTVIDVDAIGLNLAQGLLLPSAFYWDLNEGTRNFSKRFAKMHNGKMPTMMQAGVYSALIHYFKAVKAVGSADDGLKVMAEMRKIPIDDPVFGKGEVRIDGRAVHNFYLFKVKSPQESKGPWDFFQLLATIPGDQAFRPLSESDCPLVKAAR